MPFTDDILGGNNLIREAIQSPDYVPGVSGWIVRRDGSVEFNNGSFRGNLTVNSLLAGDPTGSRIEISSDGVLTLYNSLGNPVATINSNDGFKVVDSDGGYVELQPVNYYGGRATLDYMPEQLTGQPPISPGFIQPVSEPHTNPLYSPAYVQIVSPAIDNNERAVLSLFAQPGPSLAPDISMASLYADEVFIDGKLKALEPGGTLSPGAGFDIYHGDTGSTLVTMTGTSFIRQVPFNKTFPNPPLFVIAQQYSGASATLQWHLQCDNFTTTDFRLIGGGPSTTWTNVQVRWVALTQF